MWQVMTVSLKAKRVVFAPTDGVLDICKDDSNRRSRGIDFSRPVGLIPLVSGLPFCKTAVRALDAQLLGASAEAVTLKVSIRRPPQLETTNTIVIGDKVYDITRTDDNGHLVWLYLTQIKTSGQCELVSVKTTYDDLGIAKSTETRQKVYIRAITYGQEAASKGLFNDTTITLRTCDYAGERVVVMAGVRYRVQSVAGDGDWVRLRCVEGVAEVGKS